MIELRSPDDIQIWLDWENLCYKIKLTVYILGIKKTLTIKASRNVLLEFIMPYADRLAYERLHHDD